MDQTNADGDSGKVIGLSLNLNLSSSPKLLPSGLVVRYNRCELGEKMGVVGSTRVWRRREYGDGEVRSLYKKTALARV